MSTSTQSNPQRAIVLAWLLPGSICHAPNDSPEPVRRAFWSRLAACILRDPGTNRMYGCSVGITEMTFGKKLILIFYYSWIGWDSDSVLPMDWLEACPFEWAKSCCGAERGRVGWGIIKSAWRNNKCMGSGTPYSELGEVPAIVF